MKHAGIYSETVPYRALELVAFRTQGEVVFRTPEEYAATPRRGATQWQGVIVRTSDGTGTSFSKWMDERLTNTDAYREAARRVLSEGEAHNGAQ